jgi:hypothetical protein
MIPFAYGLLLRHVMIVSMFIITAVRKPQVPANIVCAHYEVCSTVCAIPS